MLKESQKPNINRIYTFAYLLFIVIYPLAVSVCEVITR